MAANCLKAGERAAELSRRLVTCACQTMMTPTSLLLDHLLDTIARRWREESGQDADLEVVPSAAGAVVHGDPEPLLEAVLALLHNGRDALQGRDKSPLKLQ